MKLNFSGLLLALAAPYCSAFVPAGTRLASSVPTLRASADDNTSSNMTPLEEVGKVAGSTLVALTLSFSAVSTPFSNEFTIPNANAFSTGTASSSITISARTADVDELIVKSLEKETREVEAEAKRDAKKAKIEKSREIFFEYEAKMAEQTEARIEAAEKKAELEAEADKELVAELDAKEKQAEKEAALATTKKEKAAKEKEARVSNNEVQLIRSASTLIFAQLIFISTIIYRSCLEKKSKLYEKRGRPNVWRMFIWQKRKQRRR